MPAAAALLQVRDGNGGLIAGQVKCIDVSGTGAGPFIPLSSLFDGNGVAGAQRVDSNFAALVSMETLKATYRYGGLSFAPVATPTDIIEIIGSATKTVRIKRVALMGAATAAGNMPASLVRRSAVPTVGSAVRTAITVGKHDSGDGAATAVVNTIGTANFGTVGTTAGIVGTGLLQMSALATGLGVDPLIWDFSTRNDKALILRGVAESLCINLAGAAVPSGGVIHWEVELEEDAS